MREPTPPFLGMAGPGGVNTLHVVRFCGTRRQFVMHLKRRPLTVVALALVAVGIAAVGDAIHWDLVAALFG